jgi:hypothetical protein
MAAISLSMTFSYIRDKTVFGSNSILEC